MCVDENSWKAYKRSKHMLVEEEKASKGGTRNIQSHLLSRGCERKASIGGQMGKSFVLGGNESNETRGT